MQTTKKEKTAINKTLIVIITVMLLIFAAYALPGTALAENDQTYTIVPGSGISDPDTSAPANMGFNDTPGQHDGRIWTDKSVDTGPGQDFTITLSALSQSFPIRDGYAIPADTVFIIDVSGSMYQETIGGRPRIAVLVDALNEAIEILLDANSRNRIAVVAYGGRTGGYSRAENILPLGRPEIGPGSAAYFTHRHAGGDSHFVDINTTNRLTASVLVQGSTPTQRGILLGANILTSATELTIPAWNADDEPVYASDGVTPLMVTRKPNFILMTDGEPTLAWDDYLFTTDPTDTNHTYGDGSNGETGVSLLTILTAAHRKQLVYDYYFTQNSAHGGSAANKGSEAVGFYTISLNDVPPPILIAATMFPFDPANIGRPGNADLATPFQIHDTLGGPYPSDAPTDSMGELLRSFSAGQHSISMYAQRRGTLPNWWVGLAWEELTVSNSQYLTLGQMAFADRFFPANDLSTLQEAFRSITTDIQRQSLGSITRTPAGNEYIDGYIAFSDVIGEYMEFKQVTSFEFDGRTYDRSGFGPAIISNAGGARDRYEVILYNHMNYGNMPDSPGYRASRYVTQSQVEELIRSNITSGHLASNNNIKYYAFPNRDFAGNFWNADGTEATRPSGAVAFVEVFPMWGTLQTPVVAEGQTDLMYVAFHMITVLEDSAVFEEIFGTDSADNPLKRSLKKDDQMLRWYIPAGLIPQRMVDHDTRAVTGNRLPIRIHYTVGLNEDRVREGISPEYIALNKSPNDENVIYFYTNRNPGNVTMAFYRPHEANPYYNIGNPGQDERGVVKTDNVTGTAGHVTINRHTESADDGRMDLHWLGNNGRLAVMLERLPEQSGSLTIAKAFEGIPVGPNIFDVVTSLTFLVVGKDADDNEIYRNVVEFNAGTFVWNHTLSRYEHTLTNLPLGNYSVYERGGHADGFMANRPGPPIIVNVTESGGLAVASFINTYTPETPTPPVTPQPPEPPSVPPVPPVTPQPPEPPSVPPVPPVTPQPPEPPSVPPVPPTIPQEPPSLTIRKVFHGLANAEKPVDFYIRITNADGFSERLDLNESVAGFTFYGLSPGDYTIEEVNHNVEGFVLSSVTINDRPETLPYTVYIEGGSAAIVITIDNYYTPPERPPQPPVPPPTEPPPSRPPGPPPSPQTGDSRNTTRSTTLLIAGIMIMGYAILKARENALP